MVAFNPNAIFLGYQSRWVKDRTQVRMGEKSRRVGWTWCEAYSAVEGCVENTRGDYFFSSADLSAAREFIGYCETFASMFNAVAKMTDEILVIDNKEILTFVLTFANGKRIVAGSSNPVFFRSKGGRARADEYAFHGQARALFKAMHGTAIVWGYDLAMWSTHNGENSTFNAYLTDIKKGRLKGAVHTVTILDAVEDGLVEKILKLKARDDKTRQEWLDNLRATIPDQAVWEEEYMCIPRSEAGSAITYELIRAAEFKDFMAGGVLVPHVIPTDPREIKTNLPLYAGWDVGRVNDRSVFWVMQRVGDVMETVLVKTFINTPYSTQLAYADLLMSSANIRRMCIDATGLGDAPAESVQDKWGKHRIEKVKFTLDVKTNLAIPLINLFVDHRIRIPSDAAIRESLHSITRQVTSAGNVRYDVSRGEGADKHDHGDYFFGAALANQAADGLKAPPREPMDLDIYTAGIGREDDLEEDFSDLVDKVAKLDRVIDKLKEIGRAN